MTVSSLRKDTWSMRLAGEDYSHITLTKTNGIVILIHCEKLALLDLSIRGYKKVDRLPISEMMNVSDAIQGIFEYI